MKTLLKIATAAAALALSVQAASATTIRTRCDHSRYGGGCTTTITGDPVPAWQLEPPEVREARISKWEAYCKPTPKPDAEFVMRMTYAHPGCEHGRDQ